MWILSAADQQGQGTTVPAIRGIMVFRDAYPTASPGDRFSLTGERVSRLAGANLYERGLMFHGPSFQGVASVLRSGQDGLVGDTLEFPRTIQATQATVKHQLGIQLHAFTDAAQGNAH